MKKQTCETCRWWVPNCNPEEFDELDDGPGVFWGCLNDKLKELVMDVSGNICCKAEFGCVLHEEI